MQAYARQGGTPWVAAHLLVQCRLPGAHQVLTALARWQVRITTILKVSSGDSRFKKQSQDGRSHYGSPHSSLRSGSSASDPGKTAPNVFFFKNKNKKDGAKALRIGEVIHIANFTTLITEARQSCALTRRHGKHFRVDCPGHARCPSSSTEEYVLRYELARKPSFCFGSSRKLQSSH